MFTSILVFIIVLSILILVHEIGHFIAARRAGIWVREFGIGLPPRVFGKKIGETIYSVNLLPFGGFVRMHGEDSSEKLRPKEAFFSKSKGARLLVVVAGVLMNFILGVFLFSVTYFFTGIPRETNKVKVVDILPSSPASESGLKVNDIIKKVDSLDIATSNGFVSYVDTKRGSKVNIVVERIENGVSQEISLTTVPRKDPPSGEGPLGVVISTTEVYYPPLWQRPFYGAYYGTKEALFWGKNIVSGLSSMIIGLFRGEVPKDVSGPVGIFAITSQAAKMGVFSLLNFVGILSINLAILNIFPFPALDGGRLFFIIFEYIFRKRVPEKFEATINMAGMAFLIFLLFLITVYDVRRLISAGGIDGFLNSFLK
jgi:regulator of sigma E protease